MTRAERENLIRAYLDGTMSSHQEHDFFINVALDAELRTELKAHRTIEEAFRKDREVDPGDILQLQGSVMAALAGTSAPDLTEEASAGADRSRKAASAAPGSWRLPTSIALSLLAVLFVSIVLMKNGSGEEGAAKAIRTGGAPAVTTPQQPAQRPTIQSTAATRPGPQTMTPMEAPSESSVARIDANTHSPRTTAPRVRENIRHESTDAPLIDDAPRSSEQPAEIEPQRAEDSLGIGIDLRIGGEK